MGHVSIASRFRSTGDLAVLLSYLIPVISFLQSLLAINRISSREKHTSGSGTSTVNKASFTVPYT